MLIIQCLQIKELNDYFSCVTSFRKTTFLYEIKSRQKLIVYIFLNLV